MLTGHGTYIIRIISPKIIYPKGIYPRCSIPLFSLDIVTNRVEMVAGKNLSTGIINNLLPFYAVNIA